MPKLDTETVKQNQKYQNSPINRATYELQPREQVLCSCGPVDGVVVAYDGGAVNVANHVNGK